MRSVFAEASIPPPLRGMDALPVTKGDLIEVLLSVGVPPRYALAPGARVRRERVFVAPVWVVLVAESMRSLARWEERFTHFYAAAVDDEEVRQAVVSVAALAAPASRPSVRRDAERALVRDMIRAWEVSHPCNPTPTHKDHTP